MSSVTCLHFVGREQRLDGRDDGPVRAGHDHCVALPENKMQSTSNIWSHIQGEHLACAKPPVDFKTKVPLWLSLPWPGQAKAELLF